MSWIETVFPTAKPVIGMVHLPPCPGTPLYERGQDVGGIVARAYQDLMALQDAGIDGVLFCNENDRPYTLRVDDVVVATMARVIGSLVDVIRVPFGVDLLWDPKASLAVAKATGAAFVREVFTGSYDSDMGLWSPRAGEALRYRSAIDAEGVRVLFNINAEFARPLGVRADAALARSVAFSSIPDGICVSGTMTGEEVDTRALREVKAAVPEVPVFANTGVRAENVAAMLQVADACIVGTSLKEGGITWNPVDPRRVERLMAAARAVEAPAKE
jgi:membrane complex biogenesis BtpA family protein